jgi:nitrogen fixation protein NifU and related proteins
MNAYATSTQPAFPNGYHPLVVELFERTPFAGRMSPGEGVFTGSAGGAEHGAEVHYWLKLVNGRVQTSSFQAYGCPHTVAAAAWIAERIHGLALVDTGQISWREAEAALAVPATKRGRLLIVEDALRAVVKAAQSGV